MKQSSGQKSGAWFWVGVTLLSLSALFWLLFTFEIVSEGDGGIFLGGVICTAIPIGIGIYCVRRGRKARALQMQRELEPVYSNQEALDEHIQRVRNQSGTVDIQTRYEWPGLENVEHKLRRDKYSISKTSNGELVASRVCWMGLGDRREYFFILKVFSRITEGQLIGYIDECEAYAQENNKWHAYSGYIVGAVAVCENPDEDAIRFSTNYRPSKEPSEAAAPVIVDSRHNKVFFFSETPRFWAVFVYGQLKKKIIKLLCVK